MPAPVAVNGSIRRSGRVSPIQTRSRSSTAATYEFEQWKEKYNLCVTKEMKTAYDRCKARVEQIIEDCRNRNRRFRDLEFDLEEDRDACLYGLERDATCRPPDVLRVTDIFRRPEPVLFKEGATADDLVQGQLQDCWFLAALATVCTASKDSNWIEEKICVKHDVQAGVYGFIFYRDSGWVDVIVDDLLFIHAPKYENLQEEEQNRFQRDKDQYNQVARSGSKSLYFASSGTEGETWVPLIEKAFAKLHGDYAALNYGFTCDAVESLTGGVYNCFHLHDILDKDKFWKEELMKLSDEVNKDKAKKDRVFSCLIASPSCDEDKLMLVRGLKPEHAYSIIDAIEHASTGKRFVKIRNPWGRGGEWNGPWSDGSREWTTKWPVPNTEEQVHIRAEDLHHTFGDDGQFIMEYDDFITTWSYVDRTKLFNDEWAYSSHWLNVSTRPSPSAWSPGDVSFSITIVEDTPAVIVLSQLDDRAFQELSGCYKWSLDFVVHKQGPGKEEIGRSVHERLWRRSINLELQNLAKGTYIVHARLDRKHKQEAYQELYHDIKAGANTTVRPGAFYADAARGKAVSMSRPYIKEAGLRRKEWDERKLAKKWAKVIASKSVASNFAPHLYGELIPIGHDFLAGRDLREIQGDVWDDEQGTSEPPLSAASDTTVFRRVAGSPESGRTRAPNTSREQSMAMFSGFVCGHCENTVGGPFWRCVECVSFDICDRCAHNSQHTLLRIETVEDVKALMQDAYGKGAHPEDCEITIGLRVYTLKDAEPTIRGSLRQGQILRGIFNQQSSQSTVRKETVKRKRTPIPSINEPKPKRRATRASLKP